MRGLKNNDYQLLEQIVSLHQPALMKTMNQFLKKNYKKVTCTKDYLFAEGDIPVALVAHLDTVFPHPAQEVYYDERKGVIWSPQGLGADDRAGVFAIIKIIKNGFRPHIIFTTDEEIGGMGATQLVAAKKEPFADMKYIIELDRQGTNDCVFYDCDNPEFSKYIESFGFLEAIGSFSDISDICPAWKIAGVNLSIGYKNEHTMGETLHVVPLLSTIDKVCAMLKDAQNLKEPFKFIPNAWAQKFYNSPYAYYSNYYDDYGMGAMVECYKCNSKFLEQETFHVKMIGGGTKYICTDCISDDVDWCDRCQEAFEVDPLHPESRLCNDCLQEIFKGAKGCTTLRESKKKLNK